MIEQTTSQNHFSAETFLSHNTDETRRLGENFAKRLRAGDLVFLQGELGAGKTTLVQGVARGLEIEGEIVSPTFVLIVEHENPNGNVLLHLDAYRLENLDEHALSDAGIFDFLARDQAIKIIEWPSRIEEYLPTPRFEIHLRRVEIASETSPDDEHRVLEIRENFSQDSAPKSNLP